MRATTLLIALVLAGSYVDDHYFYGRYMRALAGMTASILHNVYR